MTERAVGPVTQLRNELYINGFAVMEDAIPIPTIERIHASFLPLLEHVRDRDHELGLDERGDIRVGCGHLQHPCRYTVHWPWEGGLACPEIAESPTLLALLEAYWETDDFFVSCLHSNTPYPGSIHQNWHRDIPLMSPHVAMTRVPHLGVKFPLVDTSVENGSFEVLPSTQYLSDPHVEGDYNDILESGSYPHPHAAQHEARHPVGAGYARAAPRHAQPLRRPAPGVGDLLLAALGRPAPDRPPPDLGGRERAGAALRARPQAVRAGEDPTRTRVRLKR